MTLPVSPDQGCQNSIVTPFNAVRSTPREDVGWGVMVAVGGTGVLVEVGVACGAATVDVRVGDGWLPQDARRRNTTIIRMRVTGLVGSTGAILVNRDRSLKSSGLGLLGFILFFKIHLQELHSPCQSVP